MKNQIFKKAMSTALALTMIGGVSSAIGGKDIFPPAIVAKADGETVVKNGTFFKITDDLDFGTEAFVKEYNATVESTSGILGVWSATLDGEDNGVYLKKEGESEEHLMYLEAKYADTNEECTSVDYSTTFVILGSGKDDDPYYAAPVKNELASDTNYLAGSKYKQTADKDGKHYIRYAFVTDKSELVGKENAVFTAQLGEGEPKTFTTSTYYTGMTSNGAYYKPLSNDKVLFVVTITGVPADQEEALKCDLNFE